MDVPCIPLTLVTFSEIIFGSFLHIGPLIPLGESSVCQGSSFRVTMANSLIELFQEWFHCLGMDIE